MTPEQTFLSIAALAGGAAAIAAALYAVYRIARRIDDTLGLKDGKTLADRLDRVEHQLWENGGTSLADRVNSIEKHAIKTTAELEIIKNYLIPAQAPAAETPKKSRIKKAS